MENNSMIKVEHLSKYFISGNKFFERQKYIVKAIDDVSMDVRKNEIVGIVGESGSGKTTLARVILNLIKFNSGNVWVNGVDIAKATSEEIKKLRQDISVVFQDPAANLNPRVTIGSSIMRPMLIHGIPKKIAERKTKIILEKVKLDESLFYCYPHQLSGGQQQRVAIARALVLQTKLMILDEPTSALDISVQAQVLNLLLDLQEEFGITYLIITHDLNVIRYLSDRIFVMYLGKIVEYGETEQIFNNYIHPYTKALLKSAPILDPKLRRNKSPEIFGEPGSMIDINKGCRLYSRCPSKHDCCLYETPSLIEIEKNHFVSCILSKKL